MNCIMIMFSTGDGHREAIWTSRDCISKGGSLKKEVLIQNEGQREEQGAWSDRVCCMQCVFAPCCTTVKMKVIMLQRERHGERARENVQHVHV